MPERYHIVLFITVLSALFLFPNLSGAQSARPLENGATIPIETPRSTVPIDTGPQKTGFLIWLWESLTDEAHVTVGYGLLEATLTVKRESDGASATMIQRDTGALFLSYSTASSFFRDSNFGYTFMVNYVDFDMGKQEIYKNEYADLGTHITGRMIYAVPTLFYQWGEHRYQGKFVRVGVGAGVGAATYSGSIHLTGPQVPGGETIYTSKKSYEPRLAVTDFLEARWHHFGISISYAAPRIYGDGYEAKVSNFSANIGYTYYF